jgi:hypothetical protein
LAEGRSGFDAAIALPDLPQATSANVGNVFEQTESGGEANPPIRQVDVVFPNAGVDVAYKRPVE